MQVQRILGFALAWFLLAGCGAPSGPVTYPISGAVTWKKAPLAEGDIVLLDESGAAHPAAGKIKNGAFEFRSTPGKRRVEIQANREKPGQENVVMGMRDKEQYIPAQYNSKSTLSIEVKSDGQNKFNFELVD